MAYNNNGHHVPAYYRHPYPTRANAFPTYGPHPQHPHAIPNHEMALVPYDRNYARGARRGGGRGGRGGRSGRGGRGGQGKAREIIKQNRAKRVASKSPKAAKNAKKNRNSDNSNPHGLGPSTQISLFQEMSRLEDKIEDAVAKVYGEDMGDEKKFNLPKKSTSIKPIDIDLFLGGYLKFLPDLDARSSFKKSIIKFAKNPRLLCSKDIKFQKITIPENERVRNMFIKFGAWFEAEISAGRAGQKETQLLAFDKVHGKIQTAVNELIAHYNPSGIIYFIVESGEFSESMVSMFAVMNKHIVIQLNGRGRKPLDEVPADERPGVFGTRLHQIARFYRSYEGGVTVDLETKDDEVYDL